MDISKAYDELTEWRNKVNQNWQSVLEQQRRQATKKIYTTAERYSVLPYENERFGCKNGGKLIDSPLPREYYAYYFDMQGRVSLAERVEFEQPRSHHVYYYSNEGLCYIFGQQDRALGAGYAELLDGKVVRTVYASEGRHTREEYLYQGERLSAILIYQEKDGVVGDFQEKEQFFYHMGKLSCIRRVCDNGYCENRYSTQKLNYKKLAQKVIDEMGAALREFAACHSGLKVSWFLADCYTGDTTSMLRLCLDVNECDGECSGDWKYQDVYQIFLADFPIDNRQINGLYTMLADVMIAVSQLEIVEKISHGELHMGLFDHNQNIKEHSEKVKNKLSGKIFF